MNWNCKCVEATAAVKDMLGATLTEIIGMEKSSRDVYFTAADGRKWHMYHVQDCCENVILEDVCGDPKDLIGSPLTLTEETVDADGPRDYYGTITFYRFATVKGYVTLRWLGKDNGQYSESVAFYLVKE